MVQLTKDEHTLEVCAEDTLEQIQVHSSVPPSLFLSLPSRISNCDFVQSFGCCKLMQRRWYLKRCRRVQLCCHIGSGVMAKNCRTARPVCWILGR